MQIRGASFGGEAGLGWGLPDASEPSWLTRQTEASRNDPCRDLRLVVATPQATAPSQRDRDDGVDPPFRRDHVRGGARERRQERSDTAELRLEDGATGIAGELERCPQAIECRGVRATRGTAGAPRAGAKPPAAKAARRIGGRQARETPRVEGVSEASADEASLGQ